MIQDDNIRKLLERSKEKAPKSGFAVPEEYFDQLHKRTMQNISGKDTAKVVAMPSGPGRGVAALLIAASFAAVLFLVNIAPAEKTPENNALTDYSAEMINDYLEENMDEMELMAYADEVNISLLSEGSNALSEIQSNTISDFLMSESEEADWNELYNY